MVKGDFTPKKEFIGFVANVSGTRVNLINEFAYLTPHKVYGMMDEKVKLKFEICSENTINVTNVGETEISKDRIQKIIDDICGSSVGNYASKNIFSEFKFELEDGSLCYLHTNVVKPIDKLKQAMTKENKPSENSLSKIKDILNKSKKKKPKENKVEKKSKKSNSESFQSHMEEEFKKMNLEKIKELDKKVNDKENAILKIKQDIKFKEGEISKIKNDLNLTKKRLDSLKSETAEFNGYFFHIDIKEEDETKPVDFSEETKSVVGKLCKSLKVDYDKIIQMVFSSFYKIHLTKESEIDSDKKTIEEDILDSIIKLDLDGKFIIKENHIEYWGDLEWHQLNNEMEKLGFKTDSKFTDKVTKED